VRVLLYFCLHLFQFHCGPKHKSRATSAGFTFLVFPYDIVSLRVYSTVFVSVIKQHLLWHTQLMKKDCTVSSRFYLHCCVNTSNTCIHSTRLRRNFYSKCSKCHCSKFFTILVWFVGNKTPQLDQNKQNQTDSAVSEVSTVPANTGHAHTYSPGYCTVFQTWSSIVPTAHPQRVHPGSPQLRQRATASTHTTTS